jgi:hypothetical protein
LIQAVPVNAEIEDLNIRAKHLFEIETERLLERDVERIHVPVSNQGDAVRRMSVAVRDAGTVGSDSLIAAVIEMLFCLNWRG